MFVLPLFQQLNQFLNCFAVCRGFLIWWATENQNQVAITWAVWSYFLTQVGLYVAFDVSTTVQKSNHVRVFSVKFTKLTYLVFESISIF